MFSGQDWRDEKVVIKKVVNTLKCWCILFKDGDFMSLDQVIQSLYNKLQQPLLMGPSSQLSSSLVANGSSSAPSAGTVAFRSAQPTTPVHDVTTTADHLDVIGSWLDERIFEPS